MQNICEKINCLSLYILHNTGICVKIESRKECILMDYGMIFIWGVVLIGTVAFELVTTQMVSIWFACASVPALLLACFNAPRAAQIAVFIAMSVLLLILTKPLVKKLKKQPERTNVDMNIGKTAVVTETIHNELSKGRATIGGVSWMAASCDGSVIEKDEIAMITAIDGAKLIVKKISD